MASKNITFALGLLVIAIATGIILYSNNKKSSDQGPRQSTINNQLSGTETVEEISEDDLEENQLVVDTPESFLPTVETGGGAATPAQLKDTTTPVKSDAALPKTYSINIQDFAFSPNTITIKRGDKITWVNRDDMAHTATGSGFDTGLLEKDQSKTIIFNTPGEYNYACTPHPFMKGKIIVQ